MIIFYIIFSFVSISVGLDIKIGGLFDTDVNDAQQIFRCAVQVANNEILMDPNIKLDTRSIDIKYGNEFIASKSLCKLLKTGVAAIFGPSSPSSSSHCINICDAKEIPYIDVNWDADTKPPVINMHPHPDIVANIFVDLVKAWDWKGFTIIYESGEDFAIGISNVLTVNVLAPWLPRVAELLKLYDNRGYTVTIRRINVGLDSTNYRPVLRKVKLSSDTNIVIDCSLEALPEVLKQAQQVGLMTDHHQLIITAMDMHTIDLEPYQYSGTNITGIRLVDPENPLMNHITNFMAEEQSETSLTPETMTVQSALTFDGVLLLAEAFKQLDVEQLKTKQLTCNNVTSWENGNSVTNFMRNTVVHGLTGEVKFDNQGYRTNFAVDVVELTLSGIAKVGTWSSTDGLSISRKFEATSVHGSLQNRTFRVLVSLTPPYGMLVDDISDKSGNDRFEGFCIDLIKDLSDMLGFKYEFILQEDGVYGSINAANEWTGMICELLNNKADLAITDLTITSERESGADFTMPFMNLGISILYKTPTKEAPSTFAFMSPFSTEVWLYLAGAYLGVSFCFFILGRISPSEWDNPYPCIEEPTELKNQFSFRNSLWFTTGALLQQGSEIAPKAPSTRAVAAIWWFFTLIMVSSYTANLAAFLTVESVSKVINNAQELEECKRVGKKGCPEYGAKRDGSTINFFKEATEGTYKEMYNHMMDNPTLFTTSNEEGLERAKTENYAFLMESSSIEYIIERNCEVTQFGEWLDEKGYGIAMRKNSTYRSDLSEGVLKLQEQGRLSALKTKWWKEKKGGGKCAKKSSGAADAEALGLQNMKGVFYVLYAGSALATLFGIVECLFTIRKRAKRENVPFKEEFMTELRFIMNCGGNTRTIRHRKSTPINSRHSNQSNRSNASKDCN